MEQEFVNCKRCGEGIHESYPHWGERGAWYCRDCAFIEGLITEKEFLNCYPVYLPNMHAAVNEDETIEVWRGKDLVPPSKRSDKQRNTPRYAIWRNEVFKRDNYTCQDCGTIGGQLNAHHLKSWKRFKKLRFTVDNGITLCEKCHRKRHKRGVA